MKMYLGKELKVMSLDGTEQEFFAEVISITNTSFSVRIEDGDLVTMVEFYHENKVDTFGEYMLLK